MEQKYEDDRVQSLESLFSLSSYAPLSIPKQFVIRPPRYK